jgi:rod shape-determining protein MreD
MATHAAGNRLDRSARKLLPVLSALLLCLVSVIPVGVPEWQTLAPPLTLAAVFYWTVARPDLLPPTAAFGLGLFQDLLTGAPLGSGALIMVLTQWTLRGQQRFLANRPFFLLWAAFAPVLVIASALEWVIAMASSFHAIPVTGAMARVLLSFVVFPLVAWVVLIPIHRALPPGVAR